MSDDDYPLTYNPNGTITVPVHGRPLLFFPSPGLTSYDRANNTARGNVTLFVNSNWCTLETCDLTESHFSYIPSLGGNAFFASVFGLLLLVNLFQGYKYKTKGYTIGMILGLTGEVIGYAGRIGLSRNPFDPTGADYLMYLISLTIAPAFLSAAIYLCLGRIINLYGRSLSFFPPRFYALFFCSSDFLSLLLQAAGGGVASGQEITSQQGINIMIGGLVLQVISLALFALAGLRFASEVRKSPQSRREDTRIIQNSTLLKAFLVGLGTATVLIFARSVYRVAELRGGFHSAIANNQVEFMILEGVLMAIAASLLTILHPGWCFQETWDRMNFPLFRGQRDPESGSTISSDSDGKEALNP